MNSPSDVSKSSLLHVRLYSEKIRIRTVAAHCRDAQELNLQRLLAFEQCNCLLCNADALLAFLYLGHWECEPPVGTEYTINHAVRPTSTFWSSCVLE